MWCQRIIIYLFPPNRPTVLTYSLMPLTLSKVTFILFLFSFPFQLYLLYFIINLLLFLFINYYLLQIHTMCFHLICWQWQRALDSQMYPRLICSWWLTRLVEKRRKRNVPLCKKPELTNPNKKEILKIYYYTIYYLYSSCLSLRSTI